MKNFIIILIVIVLVGAGLYFFTQRQVDDFEEQEEEEQVEEEDIEEEVEEDDSMSVLGTSVQSRNINAYHYGEGDTELLFVGGIHGGYSWNTTLVAYELMDWLEANPSAIPNSVQVTVIPVLNPDGLMQTVGTDGKFTQADVPATQEETIPGRFNGNGVDLNRNFDCDWQSVGTWQSREVDGGTSAFSEPEAQAVRNYVQTRNPDAVVVWYSAVGGVFASNCHGGVLDETRELVNVYADASGYSAYEEFDFYEITGDMTNWLASEGVPAISVLLTNHEDVEWNKNRAGVEALLEYYSN